MRAASRPDIRKGIWRSTRDVAEQIHARLESREPDAASLLVPGIADRVRGMRFINDRKAHLGRNMERTFDLHSCSLARQHAAVKGGSTRHFDTVSLTSDPR